MGVFFPGRPFTETLSRLPSQKKPQERPTRPATVVVTLAALTVVIGGVKVAAPVVVPFLLAAFLAILCAPSMLWMEAKGRPRWVALLAVFLGVFWMASLMGRVIQGSAAQFVEDLPDLQMGLEELSGDLEEKLKDAGLRLPFTDREETPQAKVIGEEEPKESPSSTEAPTEGNNLIDFDWVFAMVRNLFNGLGVALGKTFMIFLSVLFILLEISSFPLKFKAVFPSTRESLGLRRFTKSIRNYIAIKTATSLATGILIGLWLAFCGVKYPVLWGLLAFLLNFVPNVGSILAAFPPCLLALIDNGPSVLFLVALAYLVVNVLIGSLLEPRVMGRGLGLSPMIVFVSLVFWGWVFGPIGMFLSVPLTMTIKIALESNDDTRWIAVLLGTEAAAKEALRQGA